MQKHAHSGHAHAPPATGKRFTVCLVIIFGFAIVEALGGWWGNSLALMSDAGHMLADSLSLLMAGIAAWISAKPPSDKHSFGLARAEVIGAFLSGLVLVVLTIWIAVEAITRLVHTEQHVAGGLVAIIAIIGLLANILVIAILLKSEQSLNVRAAVLHVLGDLLGSIGAIAAGVVIYFTGWMPIDAILSLLICLLIAFATVRLLKETISVLMEGVPEGINLKDVGQQMTTIANVNAVHDLHIWRVASNQVMLSAHVDVTTMDVWPICLKALETQLKEQHHITHVTLQPEIKEIPLVDMSERFSSGQSH
jgi:cobalt-zinc-cadmium efflux system protein